MARARRLPALLLALAALAATAAAQDHDDHPHRFVRISEDGLKPRTLRVPPETAVAWANYTLNRRVTISFEREAAKHILCKDPSAFRLTDARLESRVLGPHQFASLCELAPGTYAYRVDLRGVKKQSASHLEGVIEVVAPEAP